MSMMMVDRINNTSNYPEARGSLHLDCDLPNPNNSESLFLKGGKMEKNQEMCMECVIFQQTCDGKNLYKKPKKGLGCQNRVKSVGGDPNPLQVRAFFFLHNNFRKQRNPSLSAESCLAQAIALTSDEAFEKLSDESILFMDKKLLKSKF